MGYFLHCGHEKFRVTTKEGKVKMSIYIVEDEDNIREIETYILSNSGFAVESFSNGADFLNACEKQLPQLILLDVMLPNQDGISILKRLRSQGNTKEIPVILVTAKSSEIDKVKGLDSGADDYLTKPFGAMELVARVKALLRRTAPEVSIAVQSYKEISIDEEKREVRLDGNPCILTYKEFELLKYLISNVNIVLTREKLLEHIWGYDFEGESRTVDMHIKTLRQKLGSYGQYIKTVRNVGYKIGD